jgi:hypothetical protein
MNRAVPFLLKLIFLNLGNLVGILLILNILLILEKLLISFKWLTALVLGNLRELKWIISVWDIVLIVVVVETDLNQLRIVCEHIVLGHLIEFLLVGDLVNSLNSRSTVSWSILTHIGEFLNDIVIITLMFILEVVKRIIDESLDELVRRKLDR